MRNGLKQAKYKLRRLLVQIQLGPFLVKSGASTGAVIYYSFESKSSSSIIIVMETRCLLETNNISQDLWRNG